MEMKDRLRLSREARGLTLMEVADQIGYSHSTISNAETGRDTPGRKLLSKLIDFYQVRTDYLYNGQEPMFATDAEVEEKRAVRQNRKTALQRLEAAFAEAGRTVILDDPEGGERRVLSFAEATDDEWQRITDQVVTAQRGIGQQRAQTNGRKRPADLPKIIEFPAGHRLSPVLGNIAAGLPQEAMAETNQWVALPPKQAAETTYVLKVQGDSMIDKGIYHGDLVRMTTKREPRNGDVVAALCDHETCLKTFVAKAGQRPLLRCENKNFPPEIVPADELVIQGVMLGKVQP